MLKNPNKHICPKKLRIILSAYTAVTTYQNDTIINLNGVTSYLYDVMINRVHCSIKIEMSDHLQRDH